MFIFTYIAATLSVVFGVLTFVLLISRRDQQSLSLAGYLATGSIWIGANAIADVSYTPSVLIYSSQIAYAGGVINLFFCILLVTVLINGKVPNFAKVSIYGIPCFIAAILGFSPYAITSIYFPVGMPAQIVPGPLYTYTIYMFLIGLAYSVFILLIGLSKEQDYKRRMQFSFVLIGLILTTLAELIFDLILPVFGEYRFYTLGPIGSIFFAGFCAYSIFRYKFLNLRLAIQRSTVYTLLLSTFLIVYLVMLETFEFIFRDDSIGSFLYSSLATLVLAIITIPKIDRALRSLTDRWFFKGKYNYPEAMYMVSKILYTSGTPLEITNRLEEALTKILRSEMVKITLLNDGESLPLPSSSSNTIYPIILDQENIGYVEVGKKLSEEKYTSEDIKFLETFIYQAATTLSRYRLYQQVKLHTQELEKTVAERTEELREAHEAQRQLMVDISHNLQTPLAILQARLDQSKLFMLNDGERAGVEQTIQSLSTFIYKFLSLANMGPVEDIKVAPYRIDLLIKDIAEEVAIIAAANNIDVKVSIQKEVTILGCESRIREAIVNLASNAIKYMRSERPATITFSLYTNEHRVLITVADTGIGISSEALAKVFERFYRGDNIPYGVKGSGLGLAITKKIVELEEGSIHVDSTLNVGTTFTISLPLRA